MRFRLSSCLSYEPSIYCPTASCSLFLQYFTLSGLSTNLGLLNSGIIWGYTIAICATSYFGKVFGCTIAARIAGFNSRESATIGTLMSCKG